jgi:Kef-type K+ transport system membrane component KefB
MPKDLTYILLLFVLFVVPRFLQRYRLPSAITSLLLGVGATMLGLFDHDPTIALLATFGIVALFLLAGLDADIDELRPDVPVLLQHLGLWSVALVAVAFGASAVFDLTPRSATLVGLAVLTPSAGFILDSLGSLGLSPAEQRWTKSKAISAEFLALGVMFVVLQSTSVRHMALSTLALIGLLAVLPPLFRWFAVRVAPFAPKSEFAFLLMVAMVCASATRALGVYYLVGAFLVGIAARQFRTRLPAASSEHVLAGVEAFAAVFVPFYFFKAGQGVRPDELGTLAFLTGLVLVVGGVALRLGKTTLLRRLVLGEPLDKSLRIGLALLPTLVFTLVIADLLRDRPEVPSILIGGLVLYTILVTLLPGLLLRVPPADYQTPRLDPPAAG